MKPVQKLEADRQRHANAVEAALAKTSLLKEQLQGQDGPLLTRQQRDEYVNQLLAHHADPYSATALANASAAAADAFPDTSSSQIPAAESPHGVTQSTDWPVLQAGQGNGESGGEGEGAAADGEQVQQQQAFGIVPPTQTLVDRVRLKQLQAKLAQERSHKARHEDLAAQSVKLRKEEEAIRSREVSKARTNIQVALREDDRLATLPSKQLLQELMRAGHMNSVNMLASEHLQRQRSGIHTSASRRSLGQSTTRMPPGTTEVEEDEDEDEGDEDLSDDEDADMSFGDPEGRGMGPPGGLSVDREPAVRETLRQRSQKRAQQRAQQEAEALRRTLQDKPEQLPIHQAATIGALLQQYREEKAGPVNERQVQLETLLEALKGAMPDQERALHVLRMKHEMGAIRLHWAANRPPSHYTRESRGMTAKQQALKVMCRTMVYELVDEALSVAVMRPTKADVQRELATWKAKHTSALNDVARHVADGVLKDCVDDIIGEVTGEVMHVSTVAQSFATGVLVEAVAFSQGKFKFKGNDVRAHLRDAARHQEEKIQALHLHQNRVSLLRERARSSASIQHRRSSSTDWGGGRYSSSDGGSFLQRPLPPPHPPPNAKDAGEQRGEQEGLAKGVMMMKAKDGKSRRTVQVGEGDRNSGGQEGEAEADLIIGPGNVLVPRRQPQRRVVRFAQGVEDNMDESSMYTVSRIYEDRQPSIAYQGSRTAQGSGAYARLGGMASQWLEGAGLKPPPDPMRYYVTGLKGMLEEMRKRRGAAPFGHTQQLTPRWPAGVRVTRAQRAIVARMRPPLAAGPAVYAQRKTNIRKIKAALYPSAVSYDASEIEFVFWSKVTLTPFFYGTVLNAPLTSIAAVDKHKPLITAMGISPSGAFLAVGTANGAMLVFDLRNEAGDPWFAVFGDGDSYKDRNPSLPEWLIGRKPPATPIKALTWSVDSFQLASLDAASTLRVWWMRPEYGQVVEDSKGRQPVVPELAISIGPFMVALSGKMPVMDEMEEQSASAATAAALMQTGGKPLTEVDILHNQQQLQQQGLARNQGRVELGKWGRSVPLAFHPAFNIVGCQPSVVIPQVTGDALKLVCSFGRNTLRNRPAPYDARLNQQLLDGATCEFLMPPQVRNPGILSQSLFRAHQGHIIFIGFLSDMTTMLSVDHHGIVLLWPSNEVDRTGFGWFTPKSTWAMPRTLRTYHARGPLQAMTPPPDPWQSGGRPGSGRQRNEAAVSRWSSAVAGVSAAMHQGQGSSSPPKKSKFSLLALFGFKRGSSTGQDPLQALPTWQSEEGDPLLQHHRPWLVRMVWESRAGSARKGGQLVRQAIHRPTKRLGQGKPLIISNISLPEGRIVRRYTQHVVQANLPYQVVAASMTPSLRDLVVWARVAAQEADPHSFAFFSAHVINIETMRSTVPRIDVYDHSQGSNPPAYAITPVTPAMGTEYMFVGLGCGVIGAYSLATGQLVRELHLGMPLSSSHFVSLSLSEVSTAQGECKNAGKVLLAAVPSGSAHVYLFEVDDEVGTLEAINARQTPPSPRAEDGLPKAMYQEGGTSPAHLRHHPLPPPIPPPPLRQHHSTIQLQPSLQYQGNKQQQQQQQQHSMQLQHQQQKHFQQPHHQQQPQQQSHQQQELGRYPPGPTHMGQPSPPLQRPPLPPQPQSRLQQPNLVPGASSQHPPLPPRQHTNMQQGLQAMPGPPLNQRPMPPQQQTGTQ